MNIDNAFKIANEYLKNTSHSSTIEFLKRMNHHGYCLENDLMVVYFEDGVLILSPFNCLNAYQTLPKSRS